jgi:hypothetical protein
MFASGKFSLLSQKCAIGLEFVPYLKCDKKLKRKTDGGAYGYRDFKIHSSSAPLSADSLD